MAKGIRNNNARLRSLSFFLPLIIPTCAWWTNVTFCSMLLIIMMTTWCRCEKRIHGLLFAGQFFPCLLYAYISSKKFLFFSFIFRFASFHMKYNNHSEAFVSRINPFTHLVLFFSSSSRYFRLLISTHGIAFDFIECVWCQAARD